MKLHILLPLLFLVIIPFRLISLQTIPRGLYVDQASIGYTAYSLLTTGRDEYGFPLPVYARSFGIYIPTPAIYLTTVPIWLFGLHPWVIRLVPAILGLLTCYCVAVCAINFFPKLGKALFSLAFLVIGFSPLHILYSRDYFESSLGLLVCTISIIYFQRHRLLLGSVLLSFACYSYHSYRLLGYLLIGAMVIKFRRTMTLGLIMFIVTQLPLVYLSTFQGPSQRFLTSTWLGSENRLIPHFISNYFGYYSPYHLFYGSDPDPLRSIPEQGVYIGWLVLPYLVGILWLIRTKFSSYLFWALVIIAPVAATLTRDPATFVRANLILVPTTIVIGLGLSQFLTRRSMILRGLVGVACIWSVLFLYRSVFVLLPAERGDRWAEYEGVMQFVSNQTLPAVIDDIKPVYVLHLFYNSVDPQKVQRIQPLQGAAYYQTASWTNYYHDSNYSFRAIDWKTDPLSHQLLVGDRLTFSNSQISEHFLKPIINHAILKGFVTDPEAKQQSYPH